MERSEHLLRRLNRSMRLIEIGPSFRPLAPKRDGWQTTVVDHASQPDLVSKYASQGVEIENIEEVDVVWSGGDLAGLFPPAALGSYDAIVASHVMEHMPDPISFLASAQRLLTPKGLIILALPDKRYTFDFFEPMTTTADWLLAYEHKARTHSKRAAFNHVVYNVTNAGQITWDHTQPLSDLRLTQDLSAGMANFNDNTEAGDGNHYHDYHAWHFTPSSFMLLVLETSVVQGLDFHVTECTPAFGYEFFAVLARGRVAIKDTARLNAQRLSLLKASVLELRHATDLLLGVL